MARMNERDYLRLKRQFHEEYAKKLEALELIWQEASGGKKPPRDSEESKGGAAATRGFLADAIAEFARSHGPFDFSSKDFEDWLLKTKGHRANRTTVTHKLRRMVNEGELALAERGSGKRASRYSWLTLPKEIPASDVQIEELKRILIETNVDPVTFKSGVLQREFGVERLKELSSGQIEGLIGRYKPQPVGASVQAE
jgi:hypothetical protein